MGDRGDQDPFEDLDQFFAPIEDEDWPEGAEGESPAPPAGYPEEPAGDADDALAGLDELEIDLPDEDLLADPAVQAPAGGQAAEPPPAPAEPAGAEVPPAGAAAPPGQEWDLETSEMAGEEWDRLRAEALAAGTEEGEAEEATGEQPISVDDLAGGPPQYTDLPGPSGPTDEPSGPVLEDPLSGTGAEDDAGVFGVEDAGVSVVGPPGEPETPEPAEPAEPAEVEAAAEHFATAMRPEDVERELLSDLGDEPGPETVRIEPAAPVATEEPAVEPAAPPQAEQPGTTVAGRNLSAAMVSGGILGFAVLALLAIGKGPFLVLVVAAVLLAQAELYAVMRTRGFQPATLLGLVCGGITLVGAYLQGEGALLLGPALAMGLSVPWYMAVAPPARRNLVANAAATIFGVMYVPFLASFSVLILRPDGDIGRNMFLVVIATTVVYDVCAYAVGTIWGNRPLAPTISPHKSWEGAIGATVVVTLVIPLLTSNVDPFDFGRALGLGLLISILGPLGDLVESAIKRDFGVKDMSSLLPGHGGMLDRIDAILFVVPGAYFLLRIVLG